MLLFVLAVSLSLLISFVCSISEATLLSVGAARVEALARAGGRAGALLRRFKQEPDTPIGAILVLNTIAHTGGATVAAAQYATLFPDASAEWFATGYVVAVLLLTEILPKSLGVTHASALAAPIAYTVQAMVVTLKPVLTLTRLVSRLFTKGPTTHAPSLEEIRILASIGHNAGAFGPITAELLDNVTHLRDVKARDVMVQRDRVAFVSGNASTESNLGLVHRSGHSRFPYTPTGELDDVTGVILTKELLFSLRERTEPDWQQLQVPLLILPETATLNHVLRLFQREKRHMGIVVDEYGSTQGIITLEDVLEEIVGEIEDELDTEETWMIERPDGSLLCRGLAECEKVFAKLGLDDVETDSQTLSGFLAERLGSVPAAGAHGDVGDFRFLVTKANNRRAEPVRVIRRPADEAEVEHAG